MKNEKKIVDAADRFDTIYDFFHLIKDGIHHVTLLDDPDFIPCVEVLPFNNNHNHAYIIKCDVYGNLTAFRKGAFDSLTQLNYTTTNEASVMLDFINSDAHSQLMTIAENNLSLDEAEQVVLNAINDVKKWCLDQQKEDGSELLFSYESKEVWSACFAQAIIQAFNKK